jgi:hypothetical protein
MESEGRRYVSVAKVFCANNTKTSCIFPLENAGH